MTKYNRNTKLKFYNILEAHPNSYDKEKGL